MINIHVDFWKLFVNDKLICMCVYVEWHLVLCNLYVLFKMKCNLLLSVDLYVLANSQPLWICICVLKP